MKNLLTLALLVGATTAVAHYNKYSETETESGRRHHAHMHRTHMHHDKNKSEKSKKPKKTHMTKSEKKQMNDDGTMVRTSKKSSSSY